ncbi:MAG: hypothetical protein RI963_2037 [Planctomycetota bacterium]
MGGSGTSRPSLQPGGDRPSLGSGTTRPAPQPGLGSNIANRPSTLPGGIGSGAGIGERPGTRPGQGGGGIANRPATRPGQGGEGIANRPATLPGLGGAGELGSRLPNQGENISNRFDNRPQTLEDRRNQLSDRMSNYDREDWQQHRENMQNDRQDWRGQNREDWQDFADEHHYHHGDWYNDCWHGDGDWDFGDGMSYLWDNYPIATAFGVSRWGVNRLAYGFGYWGYANPYALYPPVVASSYTYSQPLVVYADAGAAQPVDAASVVAQQVPPDQAAAAEATELVSTTVPGSQPTDEGMRAFEEARAAFTSGDYDGALTLLDTTLKTMPRDTVVHEFRALVLFALKRYPESAAAAYAVLSAGPGWNWTTMAGLYPSVDVYTTQLRTLEDFAKQNPKSPDASFLLGYHYLTMEHTAPAHNAFKTALSLIPGDKLLTQLTQMTTPKEQRDTLPKPLPAPEPVTPDKVLTAEKMVGDWKATSGESGFDLKLAQDGRFTWSYVRGKETQKVEGVYAMKDNNLALEPDAGGTMLAQVDFASPSEFRFLMIGGDPGDQGLQFAKR